MHVIPIPCLKDNFAYLIICPQTKEAAVVDPSEAAPVLAELARHEVRLTAILNTHHHWDHVGGNAELCTAFPQIKVYGHASDRGRIQGQTEFLEEGGAFAIGDLKGHITHNPGHTTGAITYFVGGAAFTGDTLFAAGCGRLFEGTPAEMYHSLHHQIGSAPDETLIYFGHEYSENNLRFALSLEPDHLPIQEKMAKVRNMRAQGLWTTPTTLGEERATNPFLRCESPVIKAVVAKAEPNNDLSGVSVFRVIRQLKDRF